MICLFLVLGISLEIRAEEVDIASEGRLLAFSAEKWAETIILNVRPEITNQQFNDLAEEFCKKRGYEKATSYHLATQLETGHFHHPNGVESLEKVSQEFYFIGTEGKPQKVVSFDEYSHLLKEGSTPLFTRRFPHLLGGIYFNQLQCFRSEEKTTTLSAINPIPIEDASNPPSQPMTSLIEELGVDLTKMPQGIALRKHPKEKTITLGDLHGNALKLIHFLIKEGVFKVKQQYYSIFIELYQEEERSAESILDTRQLQWLNHFIDGIKVQSPPPLIRLLGDLLCDRGANDYLTLKILKRLVGARVPLEITLSNHDLEFLHFYQKLTKLEGPINSHKIPVAMVAVTPSVSLTKMQQLLTRFPTLLNEVKGIIESVYLPSLKLISLRKNDNDKKIALFSHAYTGIESISEIAGAIGAQGCSEFEIAASSSQLETCVQRVNDWFQLKMQSKLEFRHFLNTMKKESLRANLFLARPPSSPARSLSHIGEFPIFYTLWNREPGSPAHFRGVNRPAIISEYAVEYIFGHVGEVMPLTEGNLDTNLGKLIGLEIGRYRVHIF